MGDDEPNADHALARKFLTLRTEPYFGQRGESDATAVDSTPPASGRTGVTFSRAMMRDAVTFHTINYYSHSMISFPLFLLIHLSWLAMMAANVFPGPKIFSLMCSDEPMISRPGDVSPIARPRPIITADTTTPATVREHPHP